MDYTHLHAAGKHTLILPQLDRQDQPQSDTRSKKAPGSGVKVSDEYNQEV